jgi:hypothetical protein
MGGLGIAIESEDLVTDVFRFLGLSSESVFLFSFFFLLLIMFFLSFWVLGLGMDGLQNYCEFLASHGDLCS